MEVAVLATLVAIVVALLVTERVRLGRARAAIPVRIHVNGSRGKSSVTRLVAGALRAGGQRVIAKTTGTLPRIVWEDGTETPVFRLGKPNIREQIRFLRQAAARRPGAVVLECMAVQPALQYVTEHLMVRATIGVITNARADHLDAMGPTEQDVALALAGTIPQGGLVVTGEQRHLAALRTCSDARRARLVDLPPDEVAAVDDETMRRFHHVEHRENVALALRVAALCGVARDTALAGMVAAAPDPGALAAWRVAMAEREVVFAHGFAANDPESSAQVWQRGEEAFPELRRRLLVLNVRADRADRSRQLGAAIATWTRPDRVVVMGTGTALAARAALRAGLEPWRIVLAEGATAAEVFELVWSEVEERALVVGLGNVAGEGLALAALFRNHGSAVPLARFYGGAPAVPGEEAPCRTS